MHSELTQIQTLISDNNLKDAFQKFRVLTNYQKGKILEIEEWSQIFPIFLKLSTGLGVKEVTEKLELIVKNPNDMKLWFDLAYVLYETGLFSQAANLLSTFNNEFPDQPNIVNELLSSFERIGANADALELLDKSPKTKDSFLGQYLYCFNQFLGGEMANFDKEFALLEAKYQKETEEYKDELFNRIKTFKSRYDIVKNFSKLNHQDLRGWTYVINNSILLHESEHGRESMNGRYAMTAEKSDRIKFILESLKIALEKLEINISGITDLKNFKDEALRKVGEKILGLNPSGENINFTYDITSIDQTQYDILLKNLSSLSFSHAFKWTEDFVFCPSFTGFYYQFNFSPWDKPMTAGETIAEPELNQNIEESVEKILNSTKEENEEWDKDQKNLEEFCKNLKAECKKQNIPVFAKSEKLNRYFFGSFVPSGIFN